MNRLIDEQIDISIDEQIARWIDSLGLNIPIVKHKTLIKISDVQAYKKLDRYTEEYYMTYL